MRSFRQDYLFGKNKEKELEQSILTLHNFCEKNLKDYDLEETFAICSYVPPWGGDNTGMVRKAFKNLFVYYPHGDY